MILRAVSHSLCRSSPYHNGAYQGRKNNDLIPENAGFLCSYGMYLCGNKLVLNQREPLDPLVGSAVNWRDLAVQFSNGAAGLLVLI